MLLSSGDYTIMSIVPTVTLGADPELFVFNKKTKAFLSAHDLFPGSKYDPFQTAKGAIQVDGVAAEFNITPAEEVEDFLGNISHTLKLMSMMLKDHPDLTLVCDPVAYFDSEYFEGLPPDTKALGCTPDYNAWTGEINDPPKTAEPFRTGSGHIHIGWTYEKDVEDKAHFFDATQIVKQLDAVLYIPSHLWDMDTKRRSLYGKMGAFRPKSYGAEYRVLSNKWLSDQDIQEWLFFAALEAHFALEMGDKLFEHDEFLKIKDQETFTPSEVYKYVAHLEKYGMPALPKSYRSM